MPHLKMFINAEWNTFLNFVQKEAHDHHSEDKFNQFCQFIYDGATLKNKETYQSFGIQFLDRRFCHNNVLVL